MSGNPYAKAARQMAPKDYAPDAKPITARGERALNRTASDQPPDVDMDAIKSKMHSFISRHEERNPAPHYAPLEGISELDYMELARPLWEDEAVISQLGLTPDDFEPMQEDYLAAVRARDRLPEVRRKFERAVFNVNRMLSGLLERASL